MHDIPLITTISLGLSAALLFGLLARVLKLSPVVGYLVAGIAIGPSTPGFVGDLKIASQLSEIGVILLMFGVGLNFHFKDLFAVRSLVVPGALGSCTVATVACSIIAVSTGWSWQSGAVLGVAISVASTVVLLRALIDHGTIDTPEGHTAVGWLVVEDLITILVLIILPALSGDGGNEIVKGIFLALLKLVVLVALIMLAGARLIPLLLLKVARLRSRELFTLTVLVTALCVATISYVVFGASLALGAFLGGMVVGQSKVSEQAATDLLPMRDAFAVLFFVAVGMLFNLRTVSESPLLLAGMLLVILVLKPLTAFTITILSGHSLKTALTISGGLAQIGEFSFILAAMAKALGLLPASGQDILVAAAIICIALHPFWYRKVIALEPMLTRWSWLEDLVLTRNRARAIQIEKACAGIPVDPTNVQAIVIGFGPVGQTVTRLLRGVNINPTIIETNIDTVLQLQAQGYRAIYGDASRPDILNAAGMASATYLIVTVPKVDVALSIIFTARGLSSQLRIFARAAYLNQQVQLEQAGAEVIRYDEAETAAALAEAFLEEIKIPTAQIEGVLATLHAELEPKNFRVIRPG
jgi:monovalent cation:H+ antiporter-2, CPA2 family